MWLIALGIYCHSIFQNPTCSQPTLPIIIPRANRIENIKVPIANCGNNGSNSAGSTVLFTVTKCLLNKGTVMINRNCIVEVKLAITNTMLAAKPAIIVHV